MMPRHLTPACQAAAACLYLTMSLTHLSEAYAGSDKRAPRNDSYVAECGSCHVAFPPRLLPAAAWRTMMAQLAQHFGTDAGVDPATNAQIGAYLQRYAGNRAMPASNESPRITETPWFVREHRKVPAGAWSHAKVAARANCAGCHTRADAGSYREAEIRIPQ